MANDKQKQCQECGCNCTRCCSNDHDVHLHVEIENLKQKLVERDSHIATMETNVLNEANKFPKGELAALQEELLTWQDKYKRLYEAHRRIQRVNQGLEDKLLRLVDICETDKNTLTKDVATLSHKLAEANYTIKKLTEDNDRYKNDVALAIQFLQCKQSNFVSQKLDSLPNEVQAKVSSYVAGKRKPEEKKSPEVVKSIKVPIPTFPPTAMVYSIPKSQSEKDPEKEEPETAVDIVSAAIMAKVLEERERERALMKHCDTCTCSKNLKIIHETHTHTVGTQTGDSNNSLCLRCNSSLESNSLINVVKDSGLGQSKTVPIYTHDYDNHFLQVDNRNIKPNIVKVEPNNYLKESDSLSSYDSNKNAQEFVDQEATPLLEAKKGKRPPKLGSSIRHHHLCDKSSSFHESAKDTIKGPRYCSVRVQSGSKNILLDNIHHNIAPVLYTHPNDKKSKKDDQNIKIHKSNLAQTQSRRSYSSDDSKSVNYTEDSLQNQQRVVEWIESNQNLIDDGCSSDNSRCESLKKEENTKPLTTTTIIDPIKYAQMESNVKKFLFGESQSEFLKKVAIGKQNYQNLRDYNNSVHVDKNLNRSNSHTETEI